MLLLHLTIFLIIMVFFPSLNITYYEEHTIDYSQIDEDNFRMDVTTESPSVYNFPSTANSPSPSLLSNSLTIGAKKKKLREVDYLVDAMKSSCCSNHCLWHVNVSGVLLIIFLNFDRVFGA